MADTSESRDWHRRRQLRQRITLAVIVLLVIGAGLVAAGLYLGRIGGTTGGVVVTVPSPCTKAARPLDPRRVKVNVYNATGRAGLALTTAEALRRRQFSIGAVDNDPARAKVAGTALVRYGRKGSAAAKLVAAQVKGAKLAVDKRSNAVVDLVLGATFTALTPQPAVTSTAAPTCAPSPSVSRTGVLKTRPTTTPR